ncbi:MAG: hypothetical protein V4494_07790 [Chlamydiota bacterium]
MKNRYSNARIMTICAHPYFYFSALALSVLPFIYLVLSFFSSMKEQDEIELAINQLHFKEQQLLGRGASEDNFISKMKNTDHFYIDKNLESLLFLESEIAQLELQADPLLKKRLHFLKEGSNKLLFAEEEIRRGDIFQEIEERLQHPVEMNTDDLKKVLCLIEDIPIPPFSPPANAPQMIIKNFELIKKPISKDQEVYVINLQLIKREGA